MRGYRRRLGQAAGTASVAGLLVIAMSSPAFAGPVALTGHPLDHACAAAVMDAAPQSDESCRALRTLLTRVRGAAEDPAKPVLVFDDGTRDAVTAMSAAWSPGAPPSNQVLDPAAAYTASTPVTADAYSAIIVATGAQSLGKLAPKLSDYLAAGGGMLVLGDHDLLGLPPAVAYAAPARVAPAGISAGLRSALADCCEPGTAFARPTAGDAPLRVLELDAGLHAVTLAGDAVFLAGRLEAAPVVLPQAGQDGATSCSSRRVFHIHVRKIPGVSYASIAIKVPGHPLRTLRGDGITSTVDLRGLPEGRWTIQITVTTTTGRVFRGVRSYHTCGKVARHGGKHML